MLKLLGASFALTTFVAASCRCTHPSGGALSSAPAFATKFQVDEALYNADLALFTAAPHPMGSERQQVIADAIGQKIRDANAEVVYQRFTADTPNPAVSSIEDQGIRSTTLSKKALNIYASIPALRAKTCQILLASHYDTKDIPGIRFVGANDSGSSSVLLLAIMRYLQTLTSDEITALTCGITLAWFDGEEAVLEDWYEGEMRHPSRITDNTYGSRHAVSQLKPCAKNRWCFSDGLGGKELSNVILLDMIGNKNLKISLDSHSDKQLSDLLIKQAEALGYRSLIVPGRKPIADDHVPFMSRGIPSIDIIDFENIYNWHNAEDTPEHMSPESLEKAGRIALAMTWALAAKP